LNGRFPLRRRRLLFERVRRLHTVAEVRGSRLVSEGHTPAFTRKLLRLLLLCNLLISYAAG
jgi:hypothetical protein